jgi:hypothetical protein
MVVSRSQMGKTTLMIKMFEYYWLAKFEKIIIFCPTYTKDSKWRVIDKYVKSGKVNVYSVVLNDLVKKLWAEWACSANRRRDKHCLFYFDDCVGQEDFKINQETGIINMLVSKGNHDNISSVWVVQKFTQASTIMRTNAEGLFTFYMQSENEIKHVHEEFGFGKRSDFKNWLQRCTSEKYHFVFINRQGAGKPDYYHNFKLVTTQ